MSYFRASCYQGFSDDNPKGFYSVYRNLFRVILENEGADDEALDSIDFGTSQTAYVPRISDFYSYFGAFSTNLSFGRADKWDLREAPNRKIRRLMEKENNKARESARREYSDRIRELCAFVRKRDPRVVQYQAEVAAKQEEKKQALKEQQIQRQREAAEAAANYVEPDWARVASSASEKSEEYDQEEEEDFYLFECVACNKNFKSEKQVRVFIVVYNLVILYL